MPYKRVRPIDGWKPARDSEQFRSGAAVPNVFGTVQTTEILALIAFAGACEIIPLANALEIHVSAIRRRLDKLMLQGIVHMTPPTPRHVFINPRHPCGAEVQSLAYAIAVRWVARPQLEQVKAVIDFRNAQSSHEPAVLFGTRGRTRVLAALSVFGEIPVTKLANALGLRRFSLEMMLLSLKTYGLITDRFDGYRRYVTLDSTFFAYNELLAALQVLTRLDTSHQSLARLVNAVMGRVAFMK